MKLPKIKKQKIFIVVLLLLILGFLQLNLQCSKIVPASSNKLTDPSPDSKTESEVIVISSRGTQNITPILIQYNFLFPYHEFTLSSSATDLDKFNFYKNIFNWSLQIFDEFYVNYNSIKKEKINIYFSGTFLRICNGSLQREFNNFLNLHPSISSEQIEYINEINSLQLQAKCEDLVKDVIRFSGSIGSLYRGEIYDEEFQTKWKGPADVDLNLNEYLVIESLEKLKLDHETLMTKIFGRGLQKNERFLYFNTDTAIKPSLSMNNSPSDNEWIRLTLEGLGFDFVNTNLSQEFYRLFGHYIFNPYRPKLDNKIFRQDMNTAFIINNPIPFIGKTDTSFGVAQNLELNQVKKHFAICLANWLMSAEKTNKKLFSFAVDYKLSIFLDEPDLRDEYVKFNTWLEDNFFGVTDFHENKIAMRSSNKTFIEYYINKENQTTWSQFNYPYNQRMDFAFPYDLNLNEVLQGVEFVRFLDSNGQKIGFIFNNSSLIGAGKTFALIFTKLFDDNLDETYLKTSLGVSADASLRARFPDGEVSVFSGEGSVENTQEYLIIYEN